MNLKDVFDNMKRTETSEMEPINERILHGILGIADEAGELIKSVKAHVYYKQTIDILNLKEELGDLMWYGALLVDEISSIENKSHTEVLEDIFQQNKRKLHTRYPDKYTDKLARERNLEAERRAMEETGNF